MNGINTIPHHHIIIRLYNNNTVLEMRVKFLQTFASNWRRFFSSSHSSFSFSFKSFFYRFYSQLRSFSFTRDLRSHCHHRPQLCRYISILLLPPSPSSFMLHIFFVLKQGLQFQNKQLNGTNGMTWKSLIWVNWVLINI